MISRRLLVTLFIMVVASILLTSYAIRLKGRIEDPERLKVYNRPMAAPVTGPAQVVTLWVAFDENGTLRPRQIPLPLPTEPAQRARQLLKSLLSVYLERRTPHPIGDGSDVKDVYLLNGDTLIVDWNAPFADAHRSGILVEDLTILSVAQTLAVNMPDIKQIKFLVDGKERDTLAGHADLRQTYDVGVVSKAAKELSQ